MNVTKISDALLHAEDLLLRYKFSKAPEIFGLQSTLLKLRDAIKEVAGETGWPPGKLQDDSPELSAWLANRPGAQSQAKEAAMAAVVVDSEAAEREAFELAMNHVLLFDRHSLDADRYSYHDTQTAWLAWQARAGAGRAAGMGRG